MKDPHLCPGRGCGCMIVPPHMLEAIVRNGTPSQRAAAQQTLQLDRQMRVVREAQLARRPGQAPAAQARAGAGAAHKNRPTYTADHGTSLPGTLVRQEGDGAGSDVDVNEAYDGHGATFDLFYDVYGRNSIDDNGMDLIGTVHYSNQYNNAFFNGTQMVYGDGDATIFNRFTIAIDVMGHELAHGVTGTTAQLVYSNQPGALNESVSDVFGSLVKQRSLGQTADQADWLIGAGLLASGIQGVALRSMKAPGTAYDDPTLGKDPQPDHMSRYVTTTSDNGGVHINSGIPNKAFYLAAVALGGNAWEVAGKIWYNTLTDSRLASTAQFQDFANLTAEHAEKVGGAAARTTVVKAWADVGITVAAAAALAWQYDKQVLSVFASPDSMNAWAYIQDSGWRKVQPLTADGVSNTFTLLASAMALGKQVHVYVDETFIYQAYIV